VTYPNDEFSELGRPNYTAVIGASNAYCNFQPYCSVSERQRVKSDCGRKSRPNFALSSPEKL